MFVLVALLFSGQLVTSLIHCLDSMYPTLGWRLLNISSSGVPSVSWSSWSGYCCCFMDWSAPVNLGSALSVRRLLLRQSSLDFELFTQVTVRLIFPTFPPFREMDSAWRPPSTSFGWPPRANVVLPRQLAAGVAFPP